MRVRRLLLISVVATCAALAAEPGGEDSGLLGRIQEVLRIPATYTIRLGPTEAAEVVGLVKRDLEISDGKNTRRQVVYFSPDGRYLFAGRVFDLSAAGNAERFASLSVENHPSLGAKDAPVTIIEYSDFQCPYCERAHWTLKYKVLPRYQNQVRLVYKDFPLSDAHPWALQAAIAAQCAYKQGNDAFWRLHDFLFENQDELTTESFRSEILQTAGALGLDVASLQQCLESQEPLPRIQASIEEARGLGLTGTPGFLVGKEILRGAAPFSAFRAAIERQLDSQEAAQSGQKPH